MTVQVVGFGLAGACIAVELVKAGATVFILDDGLPGSTEVAAGLVNPVTGRNFQPSWRLAEFLPKAREFYADLDASLFHLMPLFRRWMGEKDRQKFEKKRDQVVPWIERVRSWLLKNGAHFEEKTADETIFCTGSRGLREETFPGIEHRCAKGEILTVKIPNWQEETIITGGGWIIPLGDQCYRVGATYEWDGLDSGPTAEGRAKVERILKQFTSLDYELIDHVSGVRPIIRQSQPVLHHDSERGWLFNGLGSKGVIYAPGVAQNWVDHLVNGRPLDSDFAL